MRSSRQPAQKQTAKSHSTKRVGPANPISKARASLGGQALRARLGSQRLEALARDPGQAHSELKRLPEMQRFVVAIQVAAEMQRRFGVSFADQFLAAVVAGTGQSLVITWQVDSGPNPEQLLKLGYHLVGMERIGNVQVWVHPEGKRLRQKLRAPTGVDEPSDDLDDGGDREQHALKGTPVEQWRPELTDAEWSHWPDQWILFEVLSGLQESNAKLAELCNRDPFPEADAKKVHRNFVSSHKYLQYASRHTDMAVFGSEVVARFGREFTAALKMHDDVVSECESIFGPLDDDE